MITIHKYTKEQIWDKTSEFIINWLKLYHNIGQKTLLLLSGGSAVKLYPAVAEFIKNTDFESDFLAFGQVDERFIGKITNYKLQMTNKLQITNGKLQFSKEDMNSYQIEKTGLWEVCKMKNIPYYLVSQEGTLEDAAEQYNKQMEKLFKNYTYKVGVLGIGEDSHTAGLIPGYENDWNKNSFAVGYEVDTISHRVRPFKKRVTVTPKALIQLDEVIVVTVGEKKKEAVKNAMDPRNLNNPDKYPAVVLQKIKKADLFTDLTL